MKWTTVNGFPDYEIIVVNKSGIIRNKKTQKILSQSIGTKGYYQVNIGGKCRRVHRLIAETLIPNPNNLETVNHDNGNKLDNSLTNLIWETRINNVLHAREVLGHKPIPYSRNDKEHHLKGKKGFSSNKGKRIIAIKDGIETIYGSAYDAADKLFGDSKLGKHIRQSIKRNSASYRGIKFKDYESNSES